MTKFAVRVHVNAMVEVVVDAQDFDDAEHQADLWIWERAGIVPPEPWEPIELNDSSMQAIRRLPESSW